MQNATLHPGSKKLRPKRRPPLSCAVERGVLGGCTAIIHGLFKHQSQYPLDFVLNDSSINSMMRLDLLLDANLAYQMLDLKT